ncbi:MAG: glycosyltransferase [Betaproteobacteria bacterium]
MTEATRNQACPCGSGLRFKQCHGRSESRSAPQAEGDRSLRYAQLMAQALAHRQHGGFDEAQRDYHAAREMDPGRPDAMAMLAEMYREQGDFSRAKVSILEALELTGWKSPTHRRSLAAIIEDESALPGPDAEGEPDRRSLARSDVRPAPANAESPQVSVIVPCYRHVRYVEDALCSVYRQSYRHIGLIVVDSGSDDGSADAIRRCLRDSPFSHHFVARKHLNAVDAINEAVELAAGAFVCLLNADDCMHEDRMLDMVTDIADTGAQWGFSSVECIDADGNAIDPLRNRFVYDLCCAAGEVAAGPTVGFSLLTQNVAASSGNLFLSRELFRVLGGFRPYRHVYGWDLCLRALPLAEPVFVRRAVYYYRIHDGNRPEDAFDAARTEATEVCSRYLRWACTVQDPVSALAPCAANWRVEFSKLMLETGLADLVDIPALRALAQLGATPTRPPQPTQPVTIIRQS